MKTLIVSAAAVLVALIVIAVIKAVKGNNDPLSTDIDKAYSNEDGE